MNSPNDPKVSGAEVDLTPLGPGAPLRYFAFGRPHMPNVPGQEWWIEVLYIGGKTSNRDQKSIKFSVLKTNSSCGHRVWELNFNPPDYNGDVARDVYQGYGIGLGDVKQALEEEATHRFLNGNAPSSASPNNAPP